MSSSDAVHLSSERLSAVAGAARSPRSAQLPAGAASPPLREEFPPLPPLPHDLGARPSLPLPGGGGDDDAVFHNISNTEPSEPAARPTRRSGGTAAHERAEKEKEKRRPVSFGKGPAMPLSAADLARQTRQRRSRSPSERTSSVTFSAHECAMPRASRLLCKSICS